MKKYTLLITASLLLLFCMNTYGQQAHYVVLVKQNNPGQVFKVTTTFPKQWIKNNWDNGYLISEASFKRGEWMIVMTKKSSKSQVYRFNPSNSIVQEKLKDGYKIEEMCPYVENNTLRTFYVFTKISTQPVRNYYYSGEAMIGYYEVYHTLNDQIKEGWDRGFRVDNARSLTYNNQTRIALFMPKMANNPPQISQARTEFPNDLINNKKAEGYYLSSITWDGYDKKWFVVMTKYSKRHVWTWFNYKTQKDKVLDYIQNKGYMITGVY